MKNILMNVPMTKATIEDRKTNTRRCFKSNEFKIDSITKDGILCYDDYATEKTFSMQEFIKKFAKYQKGETIWVREPARAFSHDLEFDKQLVTFQYVSDELIIEPKLSEHEKLADFDP